MKGLLIDSNNGGESSSMRQLLIYAKQEVQAHRLSIALEKDIGMGRS